MLECNSEGFDIQEEDSTSLLPDKSLSNRFPDVSLNPAFDQIIRRDVVDNSRDSEDNNNPD